MFSRRSFLQGLGYFAIGSVLDTTLRTQRVLAAQHDIKITAIEPYVLKGGKCWVIVRTSDGVSGIGEVSPMNVPAAALLIRDEFAPLLIGANPLDIDRCWDRVFYRTYKQGVMGLQPEALSGIDIALWDILGKVAGMPIHRLLGGKRRNTVRVYASIGGAAEASPESVAARAAAAVKDGFTAVKIRQDYGPLIPDRTVKKDLAVLDAVRKAIGDNVELKYDVNNGYSLQTAINVGKEIERFNVIHYEEPLAQTNYAGYAKLVDAVNVPVAAGEHEYTRWQFRDLIEQANVDILQPDLVKCAGISEAVKIAALASAYHRSLCPHQTQPTIGQAATLHYTSVFADNDMAQELTEGGHKSPLHDLFKTPLEYKDGHLTVPDEPGLGLEVDEEKLVSALE
ncbi:MAG: mandelate racemase/muconate lactonizing enzyme family protein [Candidatus Hydrogenedentes bacterium]|nr:mandelate racemase/muconate lactonizing enzyme family protein [Candidatus Hydrogenedentota bacterium]